MKNTDYQGKKLLDFLEKRKIQSREQGEKPRFTMTKAAEILGVARETLYQYFESKTLSREVVNNILTKFNTNESDVFGSPNKAESNARPLQFEASKENMYLVPIKAQGGFMMGYEKEVYLSQLEKIAFPLVRGECFGFEVDGFSMMPEYLPSDYVVSTPVESLEHLMKGKVYIFQTIDGILLKEFGGIEGDEAILISINEDYKPIKTPLKSIKKAYLKEFKITRN